MITFTMILLVVNLIGASWGFLTLITNVFVDREPKEIITSLTSTVLFTINSVLAYTVYGMLTSN